MATTQVETYDTSVEGRPTIAHDPNAELDYSMDWSAWLTAAGGDTIVNAVVVLESPLTAGADGVQFDTTTVTAWVKGGLPKTTKRVTFRITTAGGRVDDRSIFLRIIER